MEQVEKKRLNTGGVFPTPLRYPGGKGRLGPWMAHLLHQNGIAGGWYVEPYAGGAGAGLYLLTQHHVDHIVINDADPVIYAFWKAATESTDALIRKIQNTPVTIDAWACQRAVIECPEKYDVVEVGFAAFFLNRTNRSGILSAGVIGGKAQGGQWKIDARYNIPELCQRIRNIGLLASKITVLNADAYDLLRDAAPGFPGKCLVYLDPPYYVKGSLLYRNHYGPEDHAKIADCVLDADYPVIVTYDDCPEIRGLYKDVDSTEFSLHYSTHLARPKSNEILFYRNLTLPFPPGMTRGFQFDFAKLIGLEVGQVLG